VPDDIAKVIQNLNTGNYTRIKAVDGYTKNIGTPGRIRQGDSLSPFIFNNQFNNILIMEENITKICYAYDAVLIGETEDDLQRQIHKLHLLAAQLNINISYPENP